MGHFLNLPEQITGAMLDVKTPAELPPNPRLGEMRYVSSTNEIWAFDGVVWAIIFAGGTSSPLYFSAPFVTTGNVISMPAADATHSGYITSTDWGTIFNGTLIDEQLVEANAVIHANGTMIAQTTGILVNDDYCVLTGDQI